MRRTQKILSILSGGSGALVLTAATVKPADVDSNVAAWLQLLGWQNPPKAFLTSSADHWAIGIGLLLLAVSIFGIAEWIWPKVFKRVSVEGPTQPSASSDHLHAALAIAKSEAFARAVYPPASEPRDGFRDALDQAKKDFWTQKRQPKRDAFLKEGLGYAASGEWGMNDLMAYARVHEAMGEATDKFHQLAADGVISVWGKRATQAAALFEPIPASHWLTHRMFWPGIFREDARSQPLKGKDYGEAFTSVMISKLEFAREWPHAG